MSDSGSSSNTAIVAIFVLVLAVIIGFFAFTGGGDNGADVIDEPDIEVEITPDGGGE